MDAWPGWTTTRCGKTIGSLKADGMSLARNHGLRLCHIDDLPESGVRGFEPPEEGLSPVFVVRRGKQLFAYRDYCPHQGARLPWRKDAYLNRDGSRIVCHAHGAQFAVETGQCLLGACLGQSLQALEVHYADNGDVLIAEWPVAGVNQ